jgi:hypothetical protein
MKVNRKVSGCQYPFRYSIIRSKSEKEHSMWYGDPRNGRRAERYDRRAERYARRADRYDRRADRRAYRSPFNKLFGLLVLAVVLVVAFFIHFWAWFLLGLLVLFIGLIAVRGGFSGLLNQRFGAPSQRPQQAYAPYEPTQAPYTPYEQGHQPQDSYREGGNQFQYPSPPPSNNQSYEDPQAQYPQQGQRW